MAFFGSTRYGEAARFRLGRLAPIGAALCVAMTGCGSAINTDLSTRAPVSTPSAVPQASGSQTQVDTTSLLVLADGPNGDPTLWTVTSTGSWAAGASASGATAIARDGRTLVVALPDSLETRDIAQPQNSGSTTAVKWGSGVPRGTVACVDRSETGKTVAAIAVGEGFAFVIVGADGTASLLSPAPASPFGPSVAWLDTNRLVGLSSDSGQISRVAVVDTAGHSLTALHSIAGARVLAVSPDRSSLSAATESAVYFAPVASWLAGKEPAVVATLNPSQVVWDLALSGDGSRLAMLSGTEAEDGNVSAIREVDYAFANGAWAKTLDAAAPFTHAFGQVWLN